MWIEFLANAQGTRDALPPSITPIPEKPSGHHPCHSPTQQQ